MVVLDLERGRNNQIVRRPRFGPLTEAVARGAQLVPYVAAGVEHFTKRARSSDSAIISSQQMRGRSMSRSSSRMRSVSRFRSRSRSRSSGGRSLTTEQRDSSTRYVSRRMPRRRRRRWVRFTRKVQHVMLQMGASQTFSAKFATLKSWAADAQNYWAYMLGGVSATNNDELLKAFRVAYGSALTLADLDDYRLFIKSLCLDVQFNNNSTEGKTAIVEVYHLAVRKPYNTATPLDTQYLDTFNEIPAQSGFSKSITDPGFTPFQNSVFCSHWKIVRKQQIQLGPGELSTMQLRIPYNKMLYGKSLETSPSMLRGLTQGLLFIVKGEPENNAGAARLSSGEIIWTTQTTVNYQIPPGSTRTQTATT